MFIFNFADILFGIGGVGSWNTRNLEVERRFDAANNREQTIKRLHSWRHTKYVTNRYSVTNIPHRDKPESRPARYLLRSHSILSIIEEIHEHIKVRLKGIKAKFGSSNLFFRISRKV